MARFRREARTAAGVSVTNVQLRVCPYDRNALEEYRQAVRNGTAVPAPPAPLDTTAFDPSPMATYMAGVQRDILFGRLVFPRYVSEQA